MKNKINSENPCIERLVEGQHLNRTRKAFTLAETMIVLVILGVVAAITVPALVRNQMNAQSRTRLRKAMTVYDMALNKIVVENGIKSNDALINEFNADKNNGSCAKSRAYFKSVQDGANNCIFRASDGVWWNIEDITHPIIAFDDDDLDKADEENNKAFHLVGYLDDNGSLRVLDLAQATGNDEDYLVKLYNFVNNKKETSDIVEEGQTPYCGGLCKVSKINTLCTSRPFINCYTNDDGSGAYYFDSNGEQIMYKWNCTYGTVSNCMNSELYDRNIILPNGVNRTIYYRSCDGSGENCYSSEVTDSIALDNGGTRSITWYDCNGNGECGKGDMPQTDPSVVDTIPLDNNGKRTISYLGCNNNGEDCSASSITDVRVRTNGQRGYIFYYNCNKTGNNCSSPICRNSSFNTIPCDSF